MIWYCDFSGLCWVFEAYVGAFLSGGVPSIFAKHLQYFPNCHIVPSLYYVLCVFFVRMSMDLRINYACFIEQRVENGNQCESGSKPFIVTVYALTYFGSIINIEGVNSNRFGAGFSLL